jgi:hypothetical protein
MTFNAMVHIGAKIKEVVTALRMPVNELADKINKSRTVVYDIFERETIDTGLLLKISNVLDHNFFQYYLESTINLNEPQSSYSKNSSMLNSQLEECKNNFQSAQKEIEYLKKINQLLEEKTNKK